MAFPEQPAIGFSRMKTREGVILFLLLCSQQSLIYISRGVGEGREHSQVPPRDTQHSLLLPELRVLVCARVWIGEHTWVAVTTQYVSLVITNPFQGLSLFKGKFLTWKLAFRKESVSRERWAEPWRPAVKLPPAPQFLQSQRIRGSAG